MAFMDFYMQHHKKLIIVPVIIFVIAIFMLFTTYQNTGDIIQKDVTLQGGISATIYTSSIIDTEALEQTLVLTFGDAQVRDISEFGTDRQIGISIDISSTDEETLRSLLEEETQMVLTDENFSIEVVGSTLGQSFYNQMIKAILIAFILMAIVVFIAFRKLVPSLAVVLAALGDIVITLAIISALEVRISTSGIAALLLLIGYSIDTDVLLTTRILKRQEGETKERVLQSIKTGLTMTASTFIALFVAFFFSTSETLKQMFLIINIGLVIDVILTYFMNAPLLIWYVNRKEKKH